MILGNIITDDPIEELSIFKYYTFDNTMGLDESLPTLYIGYSNTKRLLGEINALSYKISENKFWTNTKKENNKVFVKQYFLFQIFCHNVFVRDIEYVYYDVFERYSYHKEFILKILENKKHIKCVWTHTDMLFINLDERIYGLSYEALKFIGIPPKKIKTRLEAEDITSVIYKNLKDSIKRFGVVMDTEMYSPYLLNFS